MTRIVCNVQTRMRSEASVLFYVTRVVRALDESSLRACVDVICGDFSWSAVG